MVNPNIPYSVRLADVDESVRRFVASELEGHGFDGVDVTFAQPTSAWAAGLKRPTVNMFLHDWRPMSESGATAWMPDARRRVGGEAAAGAVPGEFGAGYDRTVPVRSPLTLHVAYCVTAWTRDAVDEHRLLSQVLTILLSQPVLLSHDLVGTLQEDEESLETFVDWPGREVNLALVTALGIPPKLSIEYIVRTTFASADIDRFRYVAIPELAEVGQPENEVKAMIRDRSHRARGVILRTGAPVEGVPVVLTDMGSEVVSNKHGEFEWTHRLPYGRYHCIIKDPVVGDVSTFVNVPGPTEIDLDALRPSR